MAIIAQQMASVIGRVLEAKLGQLIPPPRPPVPPEAAIPRGGSPPPKEKAPSVQRPKPAGGKKGKGQKQPPAPPQRPTPRPTISPVGVERGGVSTQGKENKGKPLPPLTAPAPSRQQEVPWSRVVGRRERKGKTPQTQSQKAPRKGGSKVAPKQTPPPQHHGGEKEEEKAPHHRGCNSHLSQSEYSAVMEEAKRGISLAEIGVSGIRPRNAITGALVQEILGPDSQEKADRLAGKMAS